MTEKHAKNNVRLLVNCRI